MSLNGKYRFEIGHSLTDINLINRWLGTAEGRDGHDAIEQIAALPWCNGRVATAGNSWLAMAQWFIAAEQPPHLVCMAPLEGASDFYRETLCRGGVPTSDFWAFLSTKLFGMTLCALGSGCQLCLSARTDGFLTKNLCRFP